MKGIFNLKDLKIFMKTFHLHLISIKLKVLLGIPNLKDLILIESSKVR